MPRLISSIQIIAFGSVVITKGVCALMGKESNIKAHKTDGVDKTFITLLFSSAARHASLADVRICIRYCT